MLSAVRVSLQSSRHYYCPANRILKQQYAIQLGWPQLQTTPASPHKPMIQAARHLRVDPGAKRRTLAPKYKFDKVPESYSIVYESSLKNYIQALYVTVGFVGVSTATLGILRSEALLRNVTTQDGLAFGFVASAFLLTVAGLYHFAQTAIIRIYYHSDSGQFLAVRRTCLGQLRQIAYRPQDVRLKAGGKLRSNQDIEKAVDVVIKGQNCYVTAEDFISPIYYNAHLGGKDAPPDLSSAFVSGPKF